MKMRLCEECTKTLIKDTDIAFEEGDGVVHGVTKHDWQGVVQ